jgi:serine protease Do
MLEQLMGGGGALKAPRKLAGIPALTAKAKPSVVQVVVRGRMGTSTGSGAIISKEGLLLTNAHVVEGSPDGFVLIKFSNGQQTVGKIVAVNRKEDRDIALVQLPPALPNGYPYMEIAKTDELVEGDDVLALGHPLGLPFTVTRGIISGLGANRGNMYVEHLQTDAAMNPGNSGGPLVNNKGEIVGMNSQIATRNGGSVGLGFAITAPYLRDAVAQFKATGNINSSWLGIIIDRGSSFMSEDGVRVEHVRPGSPAAKAGIKPGDVLLGVRGRSFGGGDQGMFRLASVLARTRPGQELQIGLARQDEVVVVTVKLGDKL